MTQPCMLRQSADVRTLLHRAVEPFCAASGAKLNTQKCQGMVLGAHPALVGRDPATGVVFVDTAVDPIKHLGVPLSVRGATAFAEQLYEQRLHSIGYRARQWGRYDLTLLGRCEVARQVLASCLVYHAQFVPRARPPACASSSAASQPSCWAWGASGKQDSRQLRVPASSSSGQLASQAGGHRAGGCARRTSQPCRPRWQWLCCTRTGRHGSSSCAPTWRGRCQGWG